MNKPKKGMRPNWPFVVIVTSALLEFAVLVAPAFAVADTGKWRHYRDETGLEAKDYLTLDAKAGDRTWTLIRACDFSYAAIETRVEGSGEAFDLSSLDIDFPDGLVYRFRVRRDNAPIQNLTWNYDDNEFLGTEGIVSPDKVWVFDSLLFGDKLAVEINPERGAPLAVFETRGFARAHDEHCQDHPLWWLLPGSIVGSSHPRGERRDFPDTEDVRQLNARIALTAMDGEEGVAIQVLDPYDWHYVTVALITQNSREWSLYWEGFDGKGAAGTVFIPFRHFQPTGESKGWRYLNPDGDKVEAVAALAWIPDGWDGQQESPRWTASSRSVAGHYKEAFARIVVKAPLETIAWEDLKE